MAVYDDAYRISSVRLLLGILGYMS